MRALPSSDEAIDLWEVYRPAAPEHVRINMVTSADGAVVDRGGRSGSLGGDADREVFRTLRALADVIVVGAGTVRAEGYGPHRMPARLAERRAGAGRPDPAPIAVVSSSLDLDPHAPLFRDAVTRTIVLTGEGGAPARRAALAEVADVIEVGRDRAEPRGAVDALRERGLRHILLEGGPSLNADWLDAGVVDELCLTLAPSLIGTGGPPLAGQLERRVALRLEGAITAGSELLLRYAVD